MASKDATEKKTGERARAVRELLKKVEANLGKGDVKASLGDYIRLVQLQKELEAEEPKDVRLEWVDPGSGEEK